LEIATIRVSGGVPCSLIKVSSRACIAIGQRLDIFQHQRAAARLFHQREAGVLGHHRARKSFGQRSSS
jgi:hypothetical protein